MDLQKNLLKKLKNSGIKISDAPIKIIKINKKIKYTDGERFISIEPSNFKFRYRF